MATAIEWTDATWNPIIGCSRVSEGCRNCYAERQAARCAAMGWSRYQGLTTGFGAKARWTGEVRLVPEALEHPLRWKKPRRVFVNSMSDLFHEAVPDEWIDRIWAVMLLTQRHTYQVLTKRPERMRAYLADNEQTWRVLVQMDRLLGASIPPGVDQDGRSSLPCPAIWLGVSVEDQATADARIPLLLSTPAAVRWVSYEPALGPVDFSPWLGVARCRDCGATGQGDGQAFEFCAEESIGPCGLDWIVVGGESGPGARFCFTEWLTSTVEQCRAAKVPCFVKQLGAHPVGPRLEGDNKYVNGHAITLSDRKGGDMAEWPADLRVREFPA